MSVCVIDLFFSLSLHYNIKEHAVLTFFLFDLHFDALATVPLRQLPSLSIWMFQPCSPSLFGDGLFLLFLIVWMKALPAT